MDKIRLNNIQIYGYHGLFKEEKQIGQRFEVDIELTVDLNTPAKTDNINDTIDYQVIYNIVIDYFNNCKKNLIESIGLEILNGILAIKGVLETKIIIRKPSVPINGICDSVEVELHRYKDE